MNNLKIYCVTDKKLDYLEDLDLLLASAGKNQLPNKYINCNEGDNINYKEEYYSELTFHYWFWKNRLNQHTKKKELKSNLEKLMEFGNRHTTYASGENIFPCESFFRSRHFQSFLQMVLKCMR